MAADKSRRDVIANRQNEDEQTSRTQARNGKREINAPEGSHGCGTKRTSRAYKIRFDALHHRIERQDHEGQKNMCHRHKRGKHVVHHHRTLIIANETKRDECIIDHAILLQKRNPRRGAHEQRSPEGQEHNDHQKISNQTYAITWKEVATKFFLIYNSISEEGIA